MPALIFLLTYTRIYRNRLWFFRLVMASFPAWSARSNMPSDPRNPRMVTRPANGSTFQLCNAGIFCFLDIIDNIELFLPPIFLSSSFISAILPENEKCLFLLLVVSQKVGQALPTNIIYFIRKSVSIVFYFFFLLSSNPYLRYQSHGSQSLAPGPSYAIQCIFCTLNNENH